jgi:hypothetical protein
MLYSDDEVVAVAAGVPTEFPLWLPTVAREPGSTMGAVLRGVRSLFLRGLAESGPGRFDITHEAREPLMPLLRAEADVRCFFLTSFRTLPVASGGARIFVGGGAGPWHMDEVSNFGVHSTRPSTAEEFDEHVRAFVDHAVETYPAEGDPVDGGLVVSAFSRGIADTLVLKTAEGFALVGSAGREDLPVGIPDSELALKEISREEALDIVRGGGGKPRRA